MFSVRQHVRSDDTYSFGSHSNACAVWSVLALRVRVAMIFRSGSKRCTKIPQKSTSLANHFSRNMEPNSTALAPTNAQSSILPAVQVSLPSATAFIAMCKVIGDRPHHKNLHGWIFCEAKIEDKKYTCEDCPESNKKGGSQNLVVKACLKWRCHPRPACFLVPGLHKLLQQSCKNFRSIHFFK